MKSIYARVLLLLFLLITTGVNAYSPLTKNNLPPFFNATYEIIKGGMRVGEMVVSLKAQDESLVYSSITKPKGLLSSFLSSQKLLDETTLKLINEEYRPVEFIHKIEGSEKNRNEHYFFDWQNQSAKIEYKGETKELQILPTTFDSFSMQLLLMRPWNNETQGLFSVISKGRLKEHIYKLDGEEILQTGLGKLDTFKLKREKDNEEKTTYLGWYAPTQHYLPVKLERIENGTVNLSIKIIKVQWLSTANNSMHQQSSYHQSK